MITKTSKRAANTLLTVMAMIAIISSGTAFQASSATSVPQTTETAVSQTTTDTGCIDETTQDVKTKSESFDNQRAKQAADDSDQLKEAADGDPYTFTSVSYAWHSTPNCTVDLKGILVQYLATNSEGVDRGLVVVLDSSYTIQQVIVEKELFTHATGTSP